MLMNYSFILGSTLLAFIFFILGFSALGFLGGVSLTAIQLWLAVFCSLGYGFIVSKNYFAQNIKSVFMKLTLWCIVIVGIFMYFSGLFYDISYDGQVYHQEAVFQLVNGWNAFYEYLTKDMSHSAILLNHYAKGPWIYEAALFKVTGQIEQSKMFNFLLIVISLLLSLSVLLKSKKLSVKQAVLFSSLLAVNPVSIYQSLSFYIDGQLASLLLCIVVLAYQIAVDYDKFILINLIMAIALTVNIKFTGIVYVIVGMGLLCGWLWFLNKKYVIITLIKTAIIGLFIGICIMGYNPYVTNTLFYGHPFYPLYGAKAQTMDIMTSNSPQGFLTMNSLEKLFTSTFAMSTNKFDIEEPVLKAPIAVYAKELQPFIYGADIRIGGFGPLFGASIIVTLVILLIIAIQKGRDKRYIIGIIASLMLSVLIIPECWWARYVPQLWLVPVFAAIAAVINQHNGIKFIGILLSSILITNLLLISCLYYIGNYYCTKALDEELQLIAERNGVVRVFFDDFTSNKVRFAKWGISYEQGGASDSDISIHNLRYNYLTAIKKSSILNIILDKN